VIILGLAITQSVDHVLTFNIFQLYEPVIFIKAVFSEASTIFELYVTSSHSIIAAN
jgi:hypothetical protein